MTELVKSDLFFFITSIGVVAITLILAAVLVYVFFILRKVDYIVDKAKEEGSEIIDDLHAARVRSKAGIFAVAQLLKIKRNRRHNNKKQNEEK